MPEIVELASPDPATQSWVPLFIGAPATLSPPNLTSTQIAALPTGTGKYPKGALVFDTTLNKLRTNIGSDTAPIWDGGVNQQTASYTLALVDGGCQVEIAAAAANTLTIPPSSAVNYPIWTTIAYMQTGAGQTTLTAGAGVALSAIPGAKLASQWALAMMQKRATDTWVAWGNLTP
jgi:hypothetical protein